MSLQALMALLGHVTPQMTIRYATLASPTLRAAYDEAMGKMRRQFTLTPAGRPIIPDKVTWLSNEMLKTRVAHGYCSRHLAAEACAYANICEQCDNYTTSTECLPQLEAQLADRNVTIELSSAAKEWLAERGYDPLYGARPLARVIQETVKKPLAEELLFGRLVRGGAVKVTLKDGKLDFEITEAALPALPKPDEDGGDGPNMEQEVVE